MQALHALLQAAEVDMTLFFRALADVDLDAPTPGAVRATRSTTRRSGSDAEPAFDDWLARYAARVRARRAAGRASAARA